MSKSLQEIIRLQYVRMVDRKKSSFVYRGKFKETRKGKRLRVKEGEVLGCIYVPNEEHVVKVSISCGDLVVDTVEDGKSFNVLRLLYGMNGVPIQILRDGMPVSPYQEINIEVVYDSDEYISDISYDVYEHINIDKPFDHIFYQNTYNRVKVSGDSSKLPLVRRGHVLLIKSSEKASHLTLSNDEVSYRFDLPYCGEMDGYGIYKFSPSHVTEDNYLNEGINFNYFTDCKIHFTGDMNEEVTVCAITSNIFRYISKMFGVVCVSSLHKYVGVCITP